MTMKHTQPPWHRQESKPLQGQRWTFGDGSPIDRIYVATVGSQDGRLKIRIETDVSQEECDANAQLVATAPELLELCERVIAECEDTFYDPEDMAPEWVRLHTQLKAVVAKAKGGAQ